MSLSWSRFLLPWFQIRLIHRKGFRLAWRLPLNWPWQILGKGLWRLMPQSGDRFPVVLPRGVNHFRVFARCAVTFWQAQRVPVTLRTFCFFDKFCSLWIHPRFGHYYLARPMPWTPSRRPSGDFLCSSLCVQPKHLGQSLVSHPMSSRVDSQTTWSSEGSRQVSFPTIPFLHSVFFVSLSHLSLIWLTFSWILWLLFLARRFYLLHNVINLHQNFNQGRLPSKSWYHCHKKMVTSLD